MATTSSVLVEKPNAQTIRFAGKFISLSEIGRQTDLDPSYLSRIFSGKREPTLACVRKVSKALCMNVQAFLDALDYHTKS